jgi:replicative DNA helicase
VKKENRVIAEKVNHAGNRLANFQAAKKDLPHSPEAERMVLGSAIRDRQAFYQLLEVINSSDVFHIPRHALVFEAIASRATESGKWDLMMIADELERKGNLEAAGGHYYLMELVRSVATTANIEYHAKIVRERYDRRLLIRQCQESIRDAYDGARGIDEISSVLSQKLIAMPQSAQGGFEHISDVAQRSMERVQAIVERQEQPPGIKTGLAGIDDIVGVMPNKAMVVLAARPKVGKSALAATIAMNVAKEKNVAFVSVEMSNDQLSDRMVIGGAGFSNVDLWNNKINDVREIFKVLNKVSPLNLWLDDGGHKTPSMDQIMARVAAQNAKHGIDFLVIDYMQLIPEDGKEYERVSMVSRKCKQLARMVNAPTLVLSQLNRDSVRGDERPQVHHLRGSGSIEQDADMVCLMWKPSEKEIREDVTLEGVREFSVEVNRHGPTGSLRLAWNPVKVQFGDYSSRDAPPGVGWDNRADDADVPF